MFSQKVYSSRDSLLCNSKNKSVAGVNLQSMSDLNDHPVERMQQCRRPGVQPTKASVFALSASSNTQELDCC